ncbi:putative ankyrin repeat protein RF_0381 isoform X2 [Leptopilina boulardi]|uniref:putative ankyrin repeat protein RF_0381 isoform X2 n=1 Tax=Leptopilina boulardi TaxID=63433 RepID=UPI0021F5E127|nr:putative ankyrin repeat protein RF_0381 isoform X2 [Leptopilina boulardi]
MDSLSLSQQCELTNNNCEKLQPDVNKWKQQPKSMDESDHVSRAINNNEDEEKIKNCDLFSILSEDVPKEEINKAIKKCLKDGANVNVKDKDGSTFLGISAKYDNFELVKLAIENNANINATDNKGNTALHYAVAVHNYEMVKYLIENEAFVNAQNNMGNTPLHVAVSESFLND